MNPIVKTLKAFFAALSFMTRIPCDPKAANEDYSFWDWSPLFYPAAGAVIGVISSVPFIIAALLKGDLSHIQLVICAFLYVGIGYWLNRMLHLDGFCDCTDAFSAVTLSKERRLEIMKDPLVGSSAAGAAVLLIGGKVVGIAGIMFGMSKPCLLQLVILLILIPALGRLAILFTAYKARYPRKKGTGSIIVGKVPTLLLCGAVLTVAPLIYFQSLFVQVSLLVAFCIAIGYWRRIGNRALGGVTGDVLGAAVETVELLGPVLIILAAL